MHPPTVTFLHPFPDQLEAAEACHPERDHDRFSTGAWIWTVRTWLLLREAGWPVRLSAELPESGTVVFHPNMGTFPLLQRERPWERPELVLVAAVADRVRFLPADVHVVQNGYYADRPDTWFIPHWPQPGLVPRDPGRGSALTRLSYKGNAVQLHEMFRSERWRRGLADLGIAWAPDASPLFADGARVQGYAWHDYAQVDAVLAVRVLLDHLWMNRPASKLVNAWLAGVPALLGPEHAYRELRRSELDYFEVCSVEEALAALTRLQRSPALYQQMVENGRRRAGAFTTDRVREAWERLLFEELPRRARDGALPRARRAAWDVSKDFAGWESVTHPWRLR